MHAYPQPFIQVITQRGFIDHAVKTLEIGKGIEQLKHSWGK